MEIRLNGAVDCIHSVCGRATRIIVNPITHKVTDVVVRDQRWPHTERVVPIAFIEDSNRDGLSLWSSYAQWQKLRPFFSTQTSTQEIPVPDMGHDHSHSHLTLLKQRTIHCKQILPTTIDISSQTRIKVAGKSVGRLTAVLTDTAGYMIHLVMRTGAPWARRDVVIAASEIEQITTNEILLTLDKTRVTALPIVPQHRYRTAMPA